VRPSFFGVDDEGVHLSVGGFDVEEGFDHGRQFNREWEVPSTRLSDSGDQGRPEPADRARPT
jgi:hypothetical protein